MEWDRACEGISQGEREEEINPPRNKPIGVRQGERDEREGGSHPLLFTDAGFSALNVLSKMESLLGIGCFMDYVM